MIVEGESSEWQEDSWREGILRYLLKARIEFVERLTAKMEYERDFPNETPSKLCRLIKDTARILVLQRYEHS